MRRAVVAAGVLALALAAGCGSTARTGPQPDDYTTCLQGVAAAASSGNTNASPPPACSHLSADQLDAIAAHITGAGVTRILRRAGWVPASPAPTGFAAETAQEQRCTLVIEAKVNAGTLPAIHNIREHDPRLPGQCRPLYLYQLQAAVHQALKDLGR